MTYNVSSGTLNPTQSINQPSTSSSSSLQNNGAASLFRYEHRYVHMLKQVSKRNKKLMRNSQGHRREETVEFRCVGQCELKRRQSTRIVNSRTIKRLTSKM